MADAQPDPDQLLERVNAEEARELPARDRMLETGVGYRLRADDEGSNP